MVLAMPPSCPAGTTILDRRVRPRARLTRTAVDALVSDDSRVIDWLETADGLTLRPWRHTDVEAVLVAFGPEEMARQAGEPIDTVEAAERWLRARHDHWQAGSGYSWAITDRGGVVLGNVMIGAVDRHHGTGWVSYWTAQAARSRGVATAGVRAVAAWAFDDVGLFRLELGHRTNNPASCVVAARAGFLVEGLQRAKLRYDDQRYDVELHARLATDPVRYLAE
jgi:RimJ/RimL family protein N-acetyltransferase